MRAEALLTEFDVLQELRPKPNAAMITEARRQPGWKILRSIPFLGPVRSKRFAAHELREIEEIVQDRCSGFLEAWNEHFGS